MEIEHLAWKVSIILETADPWEVLKDCITREEYDAIMRALVTVGKLKKEK